jgi:hypothetical protein
LLGEILGADHDRRLRRGAPGLDQGEGQRGGKQAEPGPHPPGRAARQPGLDQSEQAVGGQRQQGRRRAADQDPNPILGLKAGEDEVAEARLSDRGRQGRGADRPYRSGADAGEQHRRSERQLDQQEALPPRHADPVRRLDHARIEALKRRHSVAHDRQQRVEAERDQGRQEAQGG